MTTTYISQNALAETKPTNTAKEQEVEDNKKAVEIICKLFANHESIKAIKKIAQQKISQLLRNIDSTKPAGIGKIPPKLITLSAKDLSKPLVIVLTNNSYLTMIISKSHKKRMFLDNAKIASVSPLDKHTDDKYSVTNF